MRALAGLILALLLALGAGPAAAAVRLKDVASLGGLRDNQLVGYGIVVGLQGTGDSMRNAPFTEQSIQSMLDRMGVNVRGASLRARNVAAVIVTANLSSLVARGSQLDVTVSALGDATSLLEPETAAPSREAAVSNSFAFGGTNSVLVFTRD